MRRAWFRQALARERLRRRRDDAPAAVVSQVECEWGDMLADAVHLRSLFLPFAGQCRAPPRVTPPDSSIKDTKNKLFSMTDTRNKYADAQAC